MCQAPEERTSGAFLCWIAGAELPSSGNRRRRVHSGYRGLCALMVSFILGRGGRSKILRMRLLALLDRLNVEARNGGTP